VPEAGFYLVYDGDADGGLLTGTHFDGEVFDDPCDVEAGTSTIETTPARLIEHLASIDGIEYPAPIPFELAGHPGLFAEITTGDSPCDGAVFTWTLPVVGDFHLEDHEKVWLGAAEVGNQTVVLVGEAFNEGAEYDGVKEAIDALVQSMTIE
jgi:hypothetical protein